jgi:uncharacterized RDD family membrane protein YckC
MNEVSTDSTPPPPTQYGGFQKRLMALLVDNILLFPLMVPLLMGASHAVGINRTILRNEMPPHARISDLVHLMNKHRMWDNLLIEQLLPLLLLTLALGWLWSRYGTSPGKWVFRLRIVDAKSLQPPSSRQQMKRAFGYMVSALLPLPLGLGFFWAVTNKRRRTWHDLIAGTVVIIDPNQMGPWDYLRRWWKRWRQNA